MTKIEHNKIVYADHSVVCDLDVYTAAYMDEMYDALSESGSAEDHIAELEANNNDGSWTIEIKCTETKLYAAFKESADGALFTEIWMVIVGMIDYEKSIPRVMPVSLIAPFIGDLDSRQIFNVLKEFEQLGAGKAVVGRKGSASRFEWTDNPNTLLGKARQLVPHWTITGLEHYKPKPQVVETV
jgi:hypothetical protein